MKLTKTKLKQIIKEELDRYVQKKFVDKSPMPMEDFDAALEEFEMKTGLEMPELVFALYDILITIDKKLAARLRSTYPDDFEARDKKEREEIEVEYK